MLSLVMNPGTSEEAVFPLPVGMVTLGRTPDNEIFCIHKSLSRKHAQLECDGQVVRIRDLGSKNGIFFEGERVDSCELVIGDTLRCGDVPFMIRRMAEPGPRPVLLHTLPSPLRGVPPFAAAARRAGGLPDSGPESSPPSILRRERELFTLVRVTELLASGTPAEDVTAELVALGGETVGADRVTLLVLDRDGHARPHSAWPSPLPGTTPYDERVVRWVQEHGTASFADATSDELLGRSSDEERGIHVAMGVPIDGTEARIGVLYTDRSTTDEGFGPDDVAFFRVLANLAAIALTRR